MFTNTQELPWIICRPCPFNTVLTNIEIKLTVPWCYILLRSLWFLTTPIACLLLHHGIQLLHLTQISTVGRMTQVVSLWWQYLPTSSGLYLHSYVLVTSKVPARFLLSNVCMHVTQEWQIHHIHLGNCTKDLDNICFEKTGLWIHVCVYIYIYTHIYMYMTPIESPLWPWKVSMSHHLRWSFPTSRIFRFLPGENLMESRPVPTWIILGGQGDGHPSHIFKEQHGSHSPGDHIGCLRSSSNEVGGLGPREVIAIFREIHKTKCRKPDEAPWSGTNRKTPYVKNPSVWTLFGESWAMNGYE